MHQGINACRARAGHSRCLRRRGALLAPHARQGSLSRCCCTGWRSAAVRLCDDGSHVVDGACRVQPWWSSGYSPRRLPPTVAVFVAAGHCWHRTQDNAACVSAAVHDGGQRQCVIATVAAMSLREPAECSSDVPLDVAPGGCRPLSLSSSLRCTASTARRTMPFLSLLLYRMAVSGGAIVRRWLPGR